MNLVIKSRNDGNLLHVCVYLKTVADVKRLQLVMLTQRRRRSSLSAAPGSASIRCMTQIGAEKMIASDACTAPVNGLLQTQHEQQAQSGVAVSFWRPLPDFWELSCHGASRI